MDMKLVQVKTMVKSRAKFGAELVPAGTPVWAIKGEGRFFRYGYTNKFSAERVAEKLKVQWSQMSKKERKADGSFVANYTYLLASTT
jgi:hypothetical protein